MEREGRLVISSSCLLESMLISKIYFVWLEQKSAYQWQKDAGKQQHTK